MTSSFKTVALFGKQPSEAVAQTLLEIRQFLTMRGFTVLFEPCLLYTSPSPRD